MNTQIHSIHFDADKRLLDFIETKLSKLGQFSDEIISADVFLRLDKSSDKENKIVEIKLSIPGNDLFAKHQSRTFEESTDNSVGALKRQLTKRKEKIRNI